MQKQVLPVQLLTANCLITELTCFSQTARIQWVTALHELACRKKRVKEMSSSVYNSI
jgi:hypothetical protein